MTAKRRAVFVIVLMSLGALAGFGFHWLLSGTTTAELPSPGGAAAPAPPEKRGVVCFGFVDLENGTTPLYPLVPGRVAQVAARDNDVVCAGTVLFTLDATAARLRVEEAKAALDAACTQRDKVRKLPEQHRLRLAQQRAAVETLGHRLSAAKHMLTVKQKLLQDKFLNPAEVSAAEDQVREVEAMRKGEEQKLAELQLLDPRPDIRAAEAEVERARAKLREAEQGVAECAVRAPQAGTVMRVLVRPGAVLDALQRQPAVLFAPDEPRVVRAEVDQEFAGQVAVGRRVRVLDDSNVQLLGRGKVTRLSGWFLRRRTVLSEPTRFNDARTLECIVTLDPGHAPLRLGQRVQVRVED
jgi:multidrug resistance efflux pump